MSKFVDMPDFDDMASLIDAIADLGIKVSMLSLRIKNKEAEVVRRALSEASFFIDGKRPSMTYLKDTLKHTGFDGELLPLREELATLSIELDKKQNILNMYKNIIDVWRSQNANQRKGSW